MKINSTNVVQTSYISFGYQLAVIVCHWILKIGTLSLQFQTRTLHLFSGNPLHTPPTFVRFEFTIVEFVLPFTNDLTNKTNIRLFCVKEVHCLTTSIFASTLVYSTRDNAN